MYLKENMTGWLAYKKCNWRYNY